MRKCDSCGKLYQESKDVFCPHCGAVAQKQCTHGSSFDSKRYDRGEIYKSNSPQYYSNTYNKNTEPHAQRKNTPHNSTENTFGNKGYYGDKVPQLNLPDFKKILSNGNNHGMLVGIIIFVIVVGFNLITGLVNYDGVADDSDLWGNATEMYVEEDISSLYTIVDKATIEMVSEEGNFKTFALEIRGMGFDDYLPENMQNDILSGAMAEQLLSEETFVEMLICDFSKKIVAEESYNNALADSYYSTGEQKDNKCKYQFTYSFDYDEIVHISGGVDFYLDNGLYINAELPFSAFSLSEDGEITYYTSYADSDTDWNTVFSECPNEQEINRDVCIDFDVSETAEGDLSNGEQ